MNSLHSFVTLLRALILAVTAVLLALTPAAPVVHAAPHLAHARQLATGHPGWQTLTSSAVAPDDARVVLADHGAALGTGEVSISALLVDETDVTPLIQSVADALDHDPKRIFDYVYNYIEYVPTFGSANGAMATLLARRGNDWDQASLLIALLKAAGITAHYVEGDVLYAPEALSNWLGLATDINIAMSLLLNGGVPLVSSSDPLGARVTRVWVEAEIGGQTVVLDPAFKQQTVFAPLASLDAGLSYNRTTFLNRAGQGATTNATSVQNLNEANIRTDLTTFSTNLLAHIEAEAPTANLDQLLGGAQIIPQRTTTLPTELPHALTVSNATEFTVIPNNRRHTLRLQHVGIDHTFAIYEIAGKRVSITYDGSGNAPVLRVEGATIATGTSTVISATLAMTMTVDHPYADDGGTFADESKPVNLFSGGNFVLLHDFNSISQRMIEARSEPPAVTVAAANADENFAEALHRIGLLYTLESELFRQVVGPLSDVRIVLHHLVGVVGQTDGYFVDIPMNSDNRAALVGEPDLAALFRLTSLFNSALEHSVLEQAQGSDNPAVSTVKMLQINNANGDKTFLANASNFNTIKPQLVDYSVGLLAQLQASVDAGRTLVLPIEGQIEVDEWVGLGYLDENNSGGNVSTAAIIFGGFNGGFSTMQQLLDANKIYDDQANGINSVAQPMNKLFGSYNEYTSTSLDPVEMDDGAFVMNMTDISIGDASPVGVQMVRRYSSNAHDAAGNVGAGWRHRDDVRLTRGTNGPLTLGAGQVMDVVPLLAYIMVALDILEGDTGLTSWMTAVLGTKWATDLLLDNTVSAMLDNHTATFVRRADDSYNPPPRAALVFSESGDGSQIVDPAGVLYFFDTQDRLGAWMDRNGNQRTYTYDGQDRLASITDSFGNSLTFSYDGQDRVTAVEDSAGRTVSYAYTGTTLTAVTDPGGNVWQYAYDDANRLTKVFQAEEVTIAAVGEAQPMVTNVYNQFGQVATQTDARGNVATFGISEFENSERQPDDATFIHLYDTQNRYVGQIDAAGAAFRYTLDGRNYLRVITDRLGATESYTHHLDVGLISTVTDGRGNTTNFTFTARNQSVANPLFPLQNFAFTAFDLTRIDYADGTNAQFVYDSKGNVTSHRDRKGTLFTFAYNAAGQTTSTTVGGTLAVANAAANAPANPAANGTITLVYNADGTLASYADSDLAAVEFDYDAALRVNRIDYPDGSNQRFTYDANDLRTESIDGRGTIYRATYDANRNRTQLVSAEGDAAARQEQWEYDPLNQPTAYVDGEGDRYEMSYTYWGALAEMSFPDNTSLNFIYDGNRRLIQIKDEANNAWSIAYDAESVPTAATSPEGRTLALQSDAMGNITAVTDPKGSEANFNYDTMGRLVQITDRLDHAVAFEYDANGELAAITVPVIGTVRYDRDELGGLLKVRALGGSEWTMTRSPMSRLTRLADPLGNQWNYGYDTSARLNKVTYPDGVVETRTFDGNNNLTKRSFTGGFVLDYTYDTLNRLTATGSAPVALTYDKQDNVTATTMHGVTIASTYGDPGPSAAKVTTVAYGSGMTVQYTYNSLGLVSKVEDDLTDTTIEFTYDADHFVTAIDRSNGVRTDFERDGNGNLTRIRHGDLGELVIDHDALDNIISLAETLPQDVSGIVLQELAAQSFDAAEQISSAGFAYDARGRRTQDPTRTYGWDNANRLVQIDENGTVTTLDYTAQGEIASRTSGGITTNYVHHYALPGSPLVAEVRNGEFVRFYVYTPSGLLLYFINVPSAQPFFYHFNQVGTALFLTDGDGFVSDTYGYNVYGKQLAHTGPNAEQLFTFNGEYGVRHEGSSGLYQMRHRYYDSTTLQFLSREPLWPLLLIPQALNPYQFALQNPLRFVDPSGLNPLENRMADGTNWENFADTLQDVEALRKLFDQMNVGIPFPFKPTLPPNFSNGNGTPTAQNPTNPLPTDSTAANNVPQSNRQAVNNSSYLNDIGRLFGEAQSGTDYFRNQDALTNLAMPRTERELGTGTPIDIIMDCRNVMACSIANTSVESRQGWLALLALFVVALGLFWLRSSRLGEGGSGGTTDAP